MRALKIKDLPHEIHESAHRLAAELVAAEHFGGSAWGFLWSHANPDRKARESRWPTYAHLFDVGENGLRIQIAGAIYAMVANGLSLTHADKDFHFAALERAGFDFTEHDYHLALRAIQRKNRQLKQLTRLTLSQMCNIGENMRPYWVYYLFDGKPTKSEYRELFDYDLPVYSLFLKTPNCRYRMHKELGPFENGQQAFKDARARALSRSRLEPPPVCELVAS